MGFGIEIERRKLLDAVRDEVPGYGALEKLKVVREHFDWEIEGYRNSLTILSDTTYEDRKHFLMELIQNADDAEYGTETPEIVFTVTNEGLELFYNEIGFSVHDIISITDTGASTKKSKKNSGLSYIGEKGIGFKSVFALAETVEIQSGPWHFYLEKERCIIPNPIDNGGEYLTGTRQKISFIDTEAVEEIYQELKRYVSGEVETFLYLQKISKFTLIDSRNDSGEFHEIEILPANRLGDRLSILVKNTGVKRDFLLYSENITFSDRLVASRWEKIGLSMGSVDRKVVIAALVHSEKKDLYGRLFCYLPTAVKLPIPIFMHVDGMTKADRERLHDPYNNEWNKFLLSQLPDIICRAIVHWAQTIESPDVFQKLIPTLSGDDQLHQVFYEVKKQLKNYNWVKVISAGDEWKKPEYIVETPPYISDLLHEYPEIRSVFEKSFSRYILDYEWNKSPELKNKLYHYGLEMISPLKMLNAFSKIELPERIKSSHEELTKLYQFILDVMDLKYSKFENPSEEFKKKLIEHVRDLSIFPIKDFGFTSIGYSSNIYFTDSSFSDNTRVSSNIRLIDSNYLDKDEAVKMSEEESENFHRLSKTMRSLLLRINVKELTEETMLTDFVLPELQTKIPFTPEERLERLLAVFSHYEEKKKLMKDVSRIVNDMDKIWLHDEDLKLNQLKNLLIPKAFRISNAEDIYDSYGLQTIFVNDKLLEELQEREVIFHDFLIDAGIKHKPQFHIKQEEYENVIAFREKDPLRYEIWRNRIRKDYTLANMVIVERVVLDEVDRDIIENGTVTSEFEHHLYTDWLSNFQDCEINDYSYYYKGKPMPGYFTAAYKRQEKRRVQMEDLDWAGINPCHIPVRTSGGALKESRNIFKLPHIKSRQVEYLLDELDGVLVGEKDSRKGAYRKLYLDSLRIRDMIMGDVDSLWEKLDVTRYNDLLKLIIDLNDSELSLDSLKIMDKTRMKLISIREFKLGQWSNDDNPLIEKQYGELGAVLGNLCGLVKDGTIESHKNVVKTILENPAPGEGLIKKFVLLLQEWNAYDTDDKMLIIDEFRGAVGDRKPPILISENKELFESLVKSGIWAVYVKDDKFEADSDVYSNAAQEIGFILPDSFGNLQISNPVDRGTERYVKCSTILKEYCGLFEEMDISRLNHKLRAFGGVNEIFKHVFFAESALRREEKSRIEYRVELPYMDSREKKVVLPSSVDYYDAILMILSMVEFAPRRNIERDLADIRKSAEKRRNVRGFELDTGSPSREIEGGTARVEDEDQMGERRPAGERFDTSFGSRDGRSSFDRNDEAQALKEIKVTDSVDAVVSEMKDKLKARVISEEEIKVGWRLGPDPEKEDSIREKLIVEIANSINDGPEIYQHKLRTAQKTTRSYRGIALGDGEVLTDNAAIDTRRFMEAEYDSRCQVCGKQLIFDSGIKWVNIYHIQDKKDGAWYYDRPFNILGLCPNCYTVAKHGGSKDFSQLLIEAQNVLNGDTFAEPVDDFSGDYYLVDVVLDHKLFKMKVSKIHMSYFVALLQANESNKNEAIQSDLNFEP